MKPVVLLACGNPSRGDDAIGPLLFERAARLCERERLAVDCLEEFQLQIENALDLRDRKLCLFVDASLDATAPFAFARARPSGVESPLTHALSPSAVLAVYERIEHAPPPPAFVLAVRGTSFELGEPLSHDALANVEAAWGLLAALLRAPELPRWVAEASGAA